MFVVRHKEGEGAGKKNERMKGRKRVERGEKEGERNASRQRV